MRKALSVAILLLSAFLFSCSKKNKNILILGNSITHQIPNKSLEWKGDWGMAASSADNDFESKLTQKLQQKYPQENIKVTSKNIAVWENDFNYDLDEFTDILDEKYDILIIRLGENVNTTAPSFQNYEKELNLLINRFKTENTKVIITGTIWNSPEKDSVQEKLAKDNNYSYVSLLDFQLDSKNYATGKFPNQQVAAHPSDEGMETIAQLLFKKAEIFYRITN